MQLSQLSQLSSLVLILFISNASFANDSIVDGSRGDVKSSQSLLSTELKNTVQAIGESLQQAGSVVSAIFESPKPRVYSQMREPCSNYSKNRQPLFGDVHIHTKYSLDASTQATRTTPDEAYRFAKGDRIGIQPWNDDGTAQRSIQLERPLDFAMVSDHAELFGETFICNTPGQEGYKSWQCKVYRGWPRGAFYFFNGVTMMTQNRLGFCGEGGELCKQAGAIPWQIMQQSADAHNDTSSACEFTAFIGYEWTGVAGAGANLHRNVLFRNHVVPELPVSWVDGSAQHLWSTLELECNGMDNSCEALTIPHNSNISQGYMFSLEHDGTEPMTKAQYALRKKYEPIVEIIQHKGASECYFGPGFESDEQCQFELLNSRGFFGNTPPKPNDGFLREVLKEGIGERNNTGVNPFEFGFIGSSDTHLGAPGAVNESIYLGHGGAGVPARDAIPQGLPDFLKYNPGGLAVVWSEENSRDAIFDSMQRRETYATSGTRIVSRFFAAWDFNQDLCEDNNVIEAAYEKGVTMGGQLIQQEDQSLANDAPAFLVLATRDGNLASDLNGSDGSDGGTALQKIQIIKGWVDASGEKQEKVYDVVGSPANDAGVDINTCRKTGSGASNLCKVWKDPDFEPSESAYYYSRVLENPSCRWSQQICIANGVYCSSPKTIGKGFEACCSDSHRPIIQERAWSSPIWYYPNT